MTDVSAFREHQARSTLIMERERINEARRLALEELRQSVNTLQRDNHLRQERLDAEQAHFTQKQTAQEAKIAAKEHTAQAIQDQVNALMTREDELRALIHKTETEIHDAVNEVNRRRQIQALLAELQNDVERLRNVGDEKESDMMRLETQLARMEMSTEKRHTQLNEALPSHPLPQMDHDKMRAMLAQYTHKMNTISNSNNNNGCNYDSAAGLEGMSNESILLVDDTMTSANTDNAYNSYHTRTEGAAVADNNYNYNNNEENDDENNENEREHNIENNDECNNEDADEE